jgi:2-alkenal reductase
MEPFDRQPMSEQPTEPIRWWEDEPGAFSEVPHRSPTWRGGSLSDVPPDDPPAPPPPAVQADASPPGRGGGVARAGALLALVLLVAGMAGAAGGGATAWYYLARTPLSTASSSVRSAASPAVAQPVSSSLLPSSPSEPFLNAVRAARPAVVTVMNLRAVRQTRTSPITYEPVGSGSGVIFDDRGYVATNNHVVDGNQGIEVLFLDGSRAKATVVGQDANYDVAILKLADGTPIPAVARLSDSSAIETGMSVVAIGSPLGTDYQNSVSTGIIAGLNRQLREDRVGFDPYRGFTRYQQSVNSSPMIQTDAAINNGNSGGPLIDMEGQVIGLNTLVIRTGAEAAVQGLGLAVPSNVVRALADEWIDGTPRPYLGISYQTVDFQTAQANNLDVAAGVEVTDVGQGTAAEKAGVKSGDLIVAIDGTPLNTDHGLTDLLWSYRAGDSLKLTLERGGQTQDVSVVLDAAPDATAP